MKRVSLGFVGGGYVGQIAHMNNYFTNPFCHFKALAEIRPQLRKRLIQHFNFESGHSHHGELAVNPDIDAVVAVTKRNHIFSIAQDILQAGKHLFTEKPMCSTIEQGETLVQIAKNKNLIYSVGYMRRHDHGILLAKKLFDEFVVSQEMGSPIFVRSHCFQGESFCGLKAPISSDENYPEDLVEAPIAPPWVPTERQMDYAIFLNVFCHNINLLRYFLGPHLKVEYVNLKNRNGFHIVFNNNYQVTLDGGHSPQDQWDERLEFLFERGRIVVQLPPAFQMNRSAEVSVYRSYGKIGWEKYPPSWTWAFKNQAEAFIEDVAKNRQPLNNAQDALEDLILIADIWKKELKIL